MKNIFENEETFEAVARIDYCYFMIGQINDEIDRMIRKATPIERAVDSVTGYREAKLDEYRKKLVEMAEEVIRSKKLIEADYSGDERFLHQLQERFGIKQPQP